MNSYSKKDQKDLYFPQTGKSSIVDNYTVDSTKVARSN